MSSSVGRPNPRIVEAATPVGLEIGMIDLLRLGEEIALMTELGVFADRTRLV